LVTEENIVGGVELVVAAGHPGVNDIKLFPSLLMMRPNKLECLSLKTLSSQVLEFEGRPEPTQLEHISDASFLGKVLVLPANGRLDWKVIASYKHSRLFDQGPRL
jgi:hypothetical protein